MEAMTGKKKYNDVSVTWRLISSETEVRGFWHIKEHFTKASPVLSASCCKHLCLKTLQKQAKSATVHGLDSCKNISDCLNYLLPKS